MGKRLLEFTWGRVSGFIARSVYGFPEKVYQRAMRVELIKRGSSAEMETAIMIRVSSVPIRG